MDMDMAVTACLVVTLITRDTAQQRGIIPRSFRFSRVAFTNRIRTAARRLAIRTMGSSATPTEPPNTESATARISTVLDTATPFRACSFELDSNAK